MRIVLRIGGSVVASPVNPVLISQYGDLLKTLRTRGHDVAVVVGGGKLAREFIGVAKSLGVGEDGQDEIAIAVSRVYAQLFLEKIGEIGCENVPLTIESVAKCLAKKKIAIMGGLRPGMTTDTVAGLIAERVKADMLVKATDQEGVFDKDPKQYADAVKLDKLRFEDLSRVFAEDNHKAGIHQIIDPEAVKVLVHHRIKVVVVNGFEPRNVLKALEGEAVGTLIE
jgi:uridylate kinase